MPTRASDRYILTLRDSDRDYDEWRFNCGPAALCALLGMRPDELRSHLGDFEQRGYLVPAQMKEVLQRLGVRYTPCLAHNPPPYGLVRVQFDGPWMRPEVPVRVRYFHTHWIGARRHDRGGDLDWDVFDVNALDCADDPSGWAPLSWWHELMVPWLCSADPHRTGFHSFTHCWQMPPAVGAPLPCPACGRNRRWLVKGGSAYAACGREGCHDDRKVEEVKQ